MEEAADAKYPKSDGYQAMYHYEDLQDLRDAFIAGAEWQASRPVTDAEVEAALLAWHTNIAPFEADYWEQDHYDMRVALEAARKVREGK